ncbi:MAG TPA: hypothetical protein VNK46_12820, partial [Nitrospiraceae bacterium]|nr:hypothetical protein [Nitrospiraceae bacterium]
MLDRVSLHGASSAIEILAVGIRKEGSKRDIYTIAQSSYAYVLFFHKSPCCCFLSYATLRWSAFMTGSMMGTSTAEIIMLDRLVYRLRSTKP